MQNKRVVITGLGAITPLGNDVKTTWENAKNGISGAAPITKFNAEHFKTRFACELKDYDATLYLNRKEIKQTDPFTQYALISSEQAIQDCGIELDKMDPFDIGVIWGSGQGGMKTYEEEIQAYTKNDFIPHYSPFFIPKLIGNMASGMISLKYGLMGINYTTISACATSNTALMDAYNYIKLGKAKVILSGGSEAPITEGSIGGFTAIRAMSNRNDAPTEASRPFDVDRDGFVIGEGSVCLVLEDYEHAKARGANIYAEIIGASMTADAYHLTATHPEGLGASRAMELALKEAQLNIEDVDYLNTHATSTPVGDLSEIKAVRKVFGDNPKNLSISATKSMTGHLLGAAGAIEALMCVHTINDGVIAPTINTQTIDPEIPDSLDIVIQEAREKEVNIAMSNTFGFGGHNAIVVFKKFND